MVGVVARRGPQPKARASLGLRAVLDFGSTVPGQFRPARTGQSRAPEARHFHRCSSRYGRLVRDIRVQGNRSPPVCVSSEVTTRPRSSTSLSIPQSNSCMSTSRIDNGRSPLSSTTKSQYPLSSGQARNAVPAKHRYRIGPASYPVTILMPWRLSLPDERSSNRNVLGGFQYNSHSLLLFQP